MRRGQLTKTKPIKISPLEPSTRNELISTEAPVVKTIGIFARWKLKQQTRSTETNISYLEIERQRKWTKKLGAKRRRQTLLLLPPLRRGLSFFPPSSWKTSSQILFPIIFHQRILYALQITVYGINGDFRWGLADLRMEGWVWREVFKGDVCIEIWC